MAYQRELPESGITNGIQFDARIGVVEMIGRLGPRAKDAAPALRAVLAEPAGKYPQDLLRPAAAEALWRVEGSSDEALPILIAGLTEEFDLADPFGRVEKKPKKTTVGEWLGKHSVRDPQGSTRRGRAAAALGRIGAPAKSALPALLVQVEKGLTLHDRLDAAEAVWRLTGDAKPVLPLLCATLEGKILRADFYNRGDVLYKLGHIRAIAIVGLMGTAAKDAAGALAAAIRAEDEFNARQTGFVRVQKRDEEDEDPDTTNLIRQTGLPVLRQLDPTAAKALAVPVKTP